MPEATTSDLHFKMNRILSLLLLLIFSPLLRAQTAEDSTVVTRDKTVAQERNLTLENALLKGWHIRVGAGLSLGGTSPLPLPREIRSIDGYNPTLCISIEAAVEKRFGQSPWGAMIGLRFENKGMKTDATTKNYHMEAVNTDGSGTVVGAWTGHVKTNVDNKYLTIPLLATYNFNDRWMVKAGPYFSYLLNGSFTGTAYDGYIRDQVPTGEKAEVSEATYDFSDDLRRFHWGLQAGGEFKAFSHLSVAANLTWGLNGIFPKDFESVTFSLFPIYATLSFNYLF